MTRKAHRKYDDDSPTRAHTENVAAGVVSGVLKALTSPAGLHSIVLLTGLVASFGFFSINHAHTDRRTNEVWDHSGTWTSNMVVQAQSLQAATNWLQSEVEDLRAQVAEFKAAKK